MRLYWVSVFVLQVTFSYALDCYTCNGVNSTSDCHTISVCKDGEDCFTQSTGISSGTTYQLGCRSINQCRQTNTTISPSSIVGRSSQTDCSQCCAIDGCNKGLCSSPVQVIHDAGECEDDPRFDCAAISAVLNVCSDIQHAKSICKKFCGLCDIVDGGWSLWNAWSSCDVTCGTGHLTRTRTCTQPTPHHGGLDCMGNSTEISICTSIVCPVDGQWSSWLQWGACTVTCDAGLQHRYRSCNNPSPSHGGQDCLGGNMDEQLCFETPCSNGSWSEWERWGRCSSTCDTGIQTRSRTCDNPSPSLLGSYCAGDNLGVQLCKLSVCTDAYDCLAILKNNLSSGSGIYTVYPKHLRHSLDVFCDMDTDRGGWTVFQYRFNGSVDFNRNYSDYVIGFGDLNGEFWLGLQNIKEMTSQNKTELRMDVIASDGATAYETYQHFYLSSSDYRLQFTGAGNGTAGDAQYGMQYYKNRRFSTYDNDDSDGCARRNYGGWWYHACANVNLNGFYGTPGTRPIYNNGEGGMVYGSFKNKENLKTAKMMFRRN